MSLYRTLTELMGQHSFLWISESTFPVEAVRMWVWNVRGWKEESLKGTDIRLIGAAKTATHSNPTHLLANLFFQHASINTSSFVRPTQKPGEYDLLIVARRWIWLEGIRTKIRESSVE
ncbi:hypothetical protein [Spirosoma koreense]